jgi:hypothetical protein
MNKCTDFEIWVHLIEKVVVWMKIDSEEQRKWSEYYADRIKFLIFFINHTLLDSKSRLLSSKTYLFTVCFIR